MRRILTLPIMILMLCGPAMAHGMSEADKIRAEGGGILEFLRQGTVHMLTGYDHLLFLFGVVFFLSQFKDIVKFITAFTLGHCITLIGATFLGIQANYFLIDAVIALTVCYKGFDNIGGFEKYLGMKSPNLIAMVFLFGLIHGFGLSTRLQQLTVGEGFDLLGKILAFNVGVEFGQIAALAVILGLLAAWRHTESFQRFGMAANTGLIIVGGLLLMMQLHGYQHQGDPISFYDLKAHQHAHEDLGYSTASFVPMGPPVVNAKSGGHSHAHAEGQEYSKIIDRIFETRKQIKNAKSNEEVLEAHHPVEEIQADLTKVRDLVAVQSGFNLELIDVLLKDAKETAVLIDAQAHDGNADTIRELAKRFDKGILGIEELVMHPGTPLDPKYLPDGYHYDPGNATPHTHAHGTTSPAVLAGYHVDPGSSVPHKDHAPSGGHSHAHAEGQEYSKIIDSIFETRKQIKNAKTDEQVLEAHHPVQEIHAALVKVRELVSKQSGFNLEVIDILLKDASEAAQLIDSQAHSGNVATIRDLLKRFDKGILGIEELVMHPGTPVDPKFLPEGYHVDAGDTVPHKHHG